MAADWYLRTYYCAQCDGPFIGRSPTIERPDDPVRVAPPSDAPTDAEALAHWLPVCPLCGAKTHVRAVRGIAAG